VRRRPIWRLPPLQHRIDCTTALTHQGWAVVVDRSGAAAMVLLFGWISAKYHPPTAVTNCWKGAMLWRQPAASLPLWCAGVCQDEGGEDGHGRGPDAVQHRPGAAGEDAAQGRHPTRGAAAPVWERAAEAQPHASQLRHRAVLHHRSCAQAPVLLTRARVRAGTATSAGALHLRRRFFALGWEGLRRKSHAAINVAVPN
jgi:hypothetical protein